MSSKRIMTCLMIAVLVNVAAVSQISAQPLAKTSESGPLTGAIKPFVDRGELPGAVLLVASRDKILALETIGEYDPIRTQSYDTGALFSTASQVKTFTALGVMMLVDQGKIKLDDPVGKYLPEFNDLRIWRMVKENGVERLRLTKPLNRLLVRHVLGHIDGLANSYLSTSQREQFPKETVDHLSVWVQLQTVNPLNTEPGTSYKYNVTGPYTAARLIEVVGGMPYTAYLRQRILEPLGMKATVDWLAAQDIPANPAGGLKITAEDNARFGQMLLNGGALDGKRFISEKTLKLMSQPRKTPPLGVGANYPLGLVIEDDHTFGTGGAGGTWMWVDTKHGLVIVFMTAGHKGSMLGQAQKAFLTAAIEKFGSRK